jgi:recombination protein RecA
MLIMIAAAAQRAGHDVIWIETEHSLNGSRADNLGVDLDTLWVTFPDYLEQGAERIEEAVNSMPKRGEKGYNKNKGLVICFDSIAATPTQAEYDGKLTDSQVAEFARLMFKFQRRMNGRIAKRNVMVVYSNQLKAKIGVMFGKKTTTYGGNAIRYHASLRFECVYTGKLKGKAKGAPIDGITMNVDNYKNKCFMPYKKLQGLEFSFSGGFNFAHCLLLALLEKGLVQKKGAKYTIYPLGKDVSMMKADFVKKVMADPVLATRLREVLDASI